MEVPRLEVELSCSLWPTPQPQPQQCQIRAMSEIIAHGNARSLSHRDPTCVLMDGSQIHYCWTTRGTPQLSFNCLHETPVVPQISRMWGFWPSSTWSASCLMFLVCTVGWNELKVFEVSWNSENYLWVTTVAKFSEYLCLWVKWIIYLGIFD